MSRGSIIYKRRMLRRGIALRKRKFRLPKQFYYELKNFVGSADFAAMAIKFRGVEAAIKSSDWFARISCHPNFHYSSQCEIWIRRMVKAWQMQQIKRIGRERLAAKIGRPKRVCEPKEKKKPPVKRPRPIQSLLRNDQVYVVSTASLSPTIAYQRLLMRYDIARGREREELARKIQLTEISVKAKIFVGRIAKNRFSHNEDRFDWRTNFQGAMLEVQFQAKGFKSTWKGELVSTGNCNTVKGWRKHFIHRRTRMSARFNNLLFHRLKASGKSHLIRDLGLARRAA